MNQASKSWRSWLSVHPANRIFPPMTPEKLELLGRAMLAKQERGEKPIPERIVLFYDGERPAASVTTKPGWWRQKTHLAKLSVGDGCHRLDAAEKYLGIDWSEECAPFIRIEYLKGEGAVDPWAFSFDANFRRRNLRPRERREVIAAYRMHRPELSDNAIAKDLVVSPTTVASITKELVAKGQVPKMETRVGRDGKKQASHKTRKAKPEEAGDARAKGEAAQVEAVNDGIDLRAAKALVERAISHSYAAQLLDVSESSIQIAAKLLRERPDLAARVEAGELSLEAAAATAAAAVCDASTRAIEPVQKIEPIVTAIEIFSLEDRRRNFIGALAVLTAEDLEWARKEFSDWLEDNTPKTAAA